MYYRPLRPHRMPQRLTIHDVQLDNAKFTRITDITIPSESIIPFRYGLRFVCFCFSRYHALSSYHTPAPAAARRCRVLRLNHAGRPR